MSKGDNITVSEVSAFDDDIRRLISDVNGVLANKHSTIEAVISGVYGLLKRYFEFFYCREGINEPVNDGVLLWYTYYLSESIVGFVTAPWGIRGAGFSFFSFRVVENGLSLFLFDKEFRSLCYDGFISDEPGNLKLNSLSFSANSIGTMEFVNFFGKKHQCTFDEFGVLESIVVDENGLKRRFDICPPNKLLSDFRPVFGEIPSVFYSLRSADSNECISLGADATPSKAYLRTFWDLPLLETNFRVLMCRKHFDRLYKITRLIREKGYEAYRHGSEPYSYNALVLQKNGNASGVGIFDGEKNDQSTADISVIDSTGYSGHYIFYTTVYNFYYTPQKYMCDLGDGSVLSVIWEAISMVSDYGLEFDHEPENVVYIKAEEMQNLFEEQWLVGDNPYYNGVAVGFLRTFKEGNVDYCLLTKRPLDNNGHLAGESLDLSSLVIDGIIPENVQYFDDKSELLKKVSEALAPALGGSYGK